MKDDYKGFRFGVLEQTLESEQAGLSLVDFVTLKLTPLARESGSLNSLELIELGSVYVNSERSLNPGRQLLNNDLVRIHSEPRRFKKPTHLLDFVTAENSDVLTVFKPAGLPTGPTVDNLRENLVSFLSDDRHQFLHQIHSIDAESEGLLVLAKSIASLESAKRAFAENRVTRTLVAFVERPVQPGTLGSNAQVKSCEERPAPTFLVSEGFFTWHVQGDPLNTYYRIEIELKGGRPGEIREVLTNHGAPVLGDRKQGSSRTLIHPETLKPSMAFVTTSFRF